MPLNPAADLPTGTVTFLFTDIQGSTKLVQELGIERWTGLLQDHYSLLRDRFSANGGHEVNTEGDAFFIAFESATDAAVACVEGQRALAGHEWPPDAVIRVRMGLHSGEAAVVGGDYMGFEIHRAARIASTGHGGQVVLSEATRSLVGARLPEGVGLLDLGEHRLKDLTQAEHLWQLTIDGLPSEFPPLKSLDYTPNNLPTQMTSFIGRETELAEGVRLLDRARLLTLTGPGGTGKTRLSLQIAADATDGFKDGVFFVPLAPVIDPELVSSAIVDALRLASSGRASPLERLKDHLRDKHVLLVLDNFEHILDAASTVGELLKAAPGTKVVVSSRAPLRVAGEQEYPIPPLPLPDPNAAATVDSVAPFAAVQLFVERAMSVRPDFALTGENAPAVAAICAVVDGLPLAIELAASRIRLFSPDVMLHRLQTSLADLVAGVRDAPARQKTLSGAIEWSYDLLDEGGRMLLGQFSVFAGGATLQHVEQVCGPSLESDALPTLEALVEQNLLRADDRSHEPRFRMLHVIREFAAEKLRPTPEYHAVRMRHAEAFLELAERAAPELAGAESMRWLETLDLEHDNLRTALTCFVERGETGPALRLVAALWRFWLMRGHVVEANEKIRQALALASSPGLRSHRLLALEAAGGIAWWNGDVPVAAADYAEALALARDLGDQVAVARNLFNGAFPAGTQDDLEPALAMTDEAIATYKALDDSSGAAEVGYVRAGILNRLGRHQEAFDLASSAATVLRGAGKTRSLAWALHSRGMAAMRLGLFENAREAFVEGLHHLSDSGDLAGVTVLLGDLSDLAVRLEDFERGIKLRGASAALQNLTGARGEQAHRDSLLVRKDASLSVSEETYREYFDAGAAMSREEVVAFALAAPPAVEAAPATSPIGPG